MCRPLTLSSASLFFVCTAFTAARPRISLVVVVVVVVTVVVVVVGEVNEVAVASGCS